MRILIIEDEKEMAEGIKGILQKAGYEADMAGDGLAGLDMIMNCQYDLVLLDLMLPMMSGLRLLENVRERGIATPVIILTAKSQTEDKIKGLDCGADDYLIKPFDAGELLARIRARMRNNDEVRRDVVYAYDIQAEFSGKFHATANAEPQGSGEGDQGHGDLVPGKANETDSSLEKET